MENSEQVQPARLEATQDQHDEGSISGGLLRKSREVAPLVSHDVGKNTTQYSQFTSFS